MGLLDIVDILLVGLLLFQVYKLLRGSLAFNIFIGLLMIYLFWLVVRALDMQLLDTILGQFIGVGVLAVIIVFQPEIRRFLLYIGKGGIFSRDNIWRRFFSSEWEHEGERNTQVLEVYRALDELSRQQIGALIICARSAQLQFYSDTGVQIRADISASMLETIFAKSSPLHDGAVIISGDKIEAAKCVLPVSDNAELPHWVGMRHRSAVGITEQSDAIAILVSEETGDIAYAERGRLYTKVSLDDAYRILRKAFKIDDAEAKKR